MEASRKTKIPLRPNTRIHTPEGALWETLSSHHLTDAQQPQTCLASTQALRSRRVSSASKSLDCVIAYQSDQSDPPVRPVRCYCTSVFGLRSWLCGSTKEPSGFLVNHQKPCELSVALLTMYIRIKVQVDLQADKSSVVVKGPFFPQV
jgi:hypothetical protein